MILMISISNKTNKEDNVLTSRHLFPLVVIIVQIQYMPGRTLHMFEVQYKVGRLDLNHRRSQQHTPRQPSRPPNTPDNDLRPHSPHIPSEGCLRENNRYRNARIPARSYEDCWGRKQVHHEKAYRGECVSDCWGCRFRVDTADEAERGAEEADHE